jgi:tRNA (guanine-N7-)-methyltransferase
MNPLRRPSVAPPAPRPWREVFGRDAELEVDVGFGRGHFLTDRARQAPGVNVVGIELRKKWVETLRARIERERIPNAYVLDGEAFALIAAHFAPGEVSRFYVFFPDPWWKRRHRKRRLWTPELVALLASRLRPGGAIYAQTDVAEYAEEIRGLLEAAPELTRAHAEAYAPWGEELPRSPRERRYVRDGVPYYQMKYLRRA